jgi:hypothetical protein
VSLSGAVRQKPDLPPHIVDLRVEATPVKVLDGLERLRELVAGPGAAGEIH